MSAAICLLHENRNDGSTPWAEEDRQWFRRHPGRTHRIRPHCEGEWALHQLRPLPPGWRWHTAVQQVAAGLRLRLPIGMEGEPAQGEHAAARLFEHARMRTEVFPPQRSAVGRA